MNRFSQHLPAAWISLLFAGSLFASLGEERDAEDAGVPLEPRAVELIETYCMICHGDDDPSGGVNLDGLGHSIENPAEAQLWQDVLDTLNTGLMPPEQSRRQPSTEEKIELIGSLTRTLVLARARLADTGGRAVARRLNRREYKNAIRDLLGVTPNIERLPPDDRVNGFDTIGSDLTFSSHHLERYFEVGREALGRVSAAPAGERRVRRFDTPLLTREANDAQIEHYQGLIDSGQKQFAGLSPADLVRLPAAERVPWEEHLHIAQRTASFPGFGEGDLIFSDRRGLTPTIPAGPRWSRGEYVLRVRVANVGKPPEGGNYLALHRDGGESRFVQVRASYDAPEVIEIPFRLDDEQSDRIVMRCRQVAKKDPTKLERQADGHPVPDQELRFWQSGIWLDWYEVEGPLRAESTDFYAEIFFDGLRSEAGGQDDYVEQIVTRFARRALRGGEPGEELIQGAVELYRVAADAGLSFPQATREALSLVLVSPSFLYMIEPGGETRAPVSDLELANRLAFFLWSAPPDAALVGLAQANRLRDPYVLTAQIGRMLDSPRASAFYETFTHQWLELERLEGVVLPFDYDDALMLSAAREPAELFAHLVRTGESLTNLVESEFVVVDSMLASFYGIEGVQGDGFRAVTLPGDSERGGLLSQLAVLAMGGDGKRTLPVHRGAWVMRKLLDDPPAPPPPNVPALHPDGVASAREMMERHRADPACASCHQTMDAIGLGMENFGPLGRWRDTEALTLRAVKTPKGRYQMYEVEDPPEVAIDPSGHLDRGATPFTTYRELRSLLADRNDALVRGLAKALIHYGMGRRPSIVDDPFLDDLVERSRASDHDARAFLIEFLMSETFRTK